MTRVLETPLHHASDLLTWLDASRDDGQGNLPRIDQPLTITLSDAPRDTQLIQRPGQTLVWRRSQAELHPVVAGEASEAQRERPTASTFTLAGSVSDPAGRFNPRLFSVTAGAAAGHALQLYPSPAGTLLGAAGGLQLALRYADAVAMDAPPETDRFVGERVAAWALVTVAVTPLVGPVQTYVAQADARGECRIALRRVPQLPKDAPAPDYAAVLTVQADPATLDDPAVDPDSLPDRQLGDPATANTFIDQVSFRFRPGQQLSLTSHGKDHLVLPAT